MDEPTNNVRWWQPESQGFIAGKSGPSSESNLRPMTPVMWLGEDSTKLTSRGPGFVLLQNLDVTLMFCWASDIGTQLTVKHVGHNIRLISRCQLSYAVHSEVTPWPSQSIYTLGIHYLIPQLSSFPMGDHSDSWTPNDPSARYVCFISEYPSTEWHSPFIMRMIKLSIQYASLGKLPTPFEATQISLPKLLAALLYYDYSLTWTREFKYIWCRKFTISTALYIACRYALVANVLFVLAINNKLPSLRVCTHAAQLEISDSLCNGSTL